MISLRTDPRICRVGTVFRSMSGGHEGEVQQRVANLTRYGETLQAKWARAVGTGPDWSGHRLWLVPTMLCPTAGML